MSIRKSRQKSQDHQIHHHNRNAAAISAVTRANARRAGAESAGRNRSIGAVLDCRFTSGGAKAAGALRR
jgi:hypothetical protein